MRLRRVDPAASGSRDGVTIPIGDLDLPDQLGEVTGHTVTERRVLRLLHGEP